MAQILVNKRNATNADIIREMVKIAPLAVKQVQPLVTKFKAASCIKTCKNVFDFALNNFPYKEDPEHKQLIKLPLKQLKDAVRGIPTDCKTFALFCGSILKACGYDPCFKFCSYDSDPTPSHVYVVCNGIKVDPVYKVFNEEKPYKHMNLQVINGLQGVGYTELRPVAGIKDIWNKVKQTVSTGTKTAAGAAKTAGLAPARLAFLGLVAINALNLAGALDKGRGKGKESKLSTVWKKFGGNPEKLWGSVNQGKKHKPIAKGLGPKSIGAEPVTMATVTTAIATATPIIIAIVSALKESGVNLEDSPLIPKTGLAPQGELDASGFKQTFNNILSTAKQVFTSQTGTDPVSEAQTMLTTATPSDAMLQSDQAGTTTPEEEKKGILSNPIVLLGGALIAAKLLKVF